MSSIISIERAGLKITGSASNGKKKYNLIIGFARIKTYA